MLTDRRQQQAICDLLNGHPPALNPATLTAPYDYLRDVINNYLPDKYEAAQALFQVKLEYPDLAAPIESILQLKPAYKIHYDHLAHIGPNLPEVTWYWPNWIPRGLLTVLAADAGVGKTNVALDIARRGMMNLPAPDGEPLDVQSGNIIYVDAEGFLSVVYSRLSAWDLDMTRFYPIQKPRRETLDLGNKANQDRLIDMCYDLRPDLVIVDSLSSISSKGENSVEDMRDILNFLADLADNFNLALLLIHHLRKPSPGSNGHTPTVSMHDLRGSTHLVAMARSILGLHVAGQDVNGPRRLQVIKTNLCKHPRPLFMRYVPSIERPDISMVAYEQVDKKLLPETITGRCSIWLLDMLADGPMTYAELKEAAEEEGYKENILQFARKALDWQVVDTIGPKVRGNKWALYNPDDDQNSFFTHDLHGHVIDGGGADMLPPPSHDPCNSCDDSQILENEEENALSTSPLPQKLETNQPERQKPSRLALSMVRRSAWPAPPGDRLNGDPHHRPPGSAPPRWFTGRQTQQTGLPARKPGRALSALPPQLRPRRTRH